MAKQFNHVKFILDFVPDAQCRLHLRITKDTNYLCQKKCAPNGQEYFMPMHLMPYYYGSALPDYDYFETSCRKVKLVFTWDKFNSFQRDFSKPYLSWFGYFDSKLKANKEYKTRLKKGILKELDINLVKDQELISAVEGLVLK